MSKFNWREISQKLIANLNEREREIISRRFGFGGKERETLEAIGKDFGVCRERTRQIQEVALRKVRQNLPQYKEVFQFLDKYLESFGGLRKEENLISELGGENKNEVFFLLFLSSNLQRFPENEECFTFWFTKTSVVDLVKKEINSVIFQLEKEKRLLSLEELKSSIDKKILKEWLEVSKRIGKTKNGLYGLREWPEITPRGMKDKAYLVLKEIGKPLHFREIAKNIENANLHTVHNELIRDPRFVLVGRGIYALSEWGYTKGEVKEVILKILSKEKRPLTKEEIIERVLKQRIVKKATILMNLSNRKYFQRDAQGRYYLKTEIA